MNELINVESYMQNLLKDQNGLIQDIKKKISYIENN